MFYGEASAASCDECKLNGCIFYGQFTRRVCARQYDVVHGGVRNADWWNQIREDLRTLHRGNVISHGVIENVLFVRPKRCVRFSNCSVSQTLHVREVKD